MVFEKNSFFTLKKVQYFFSRQGRRVDAGRVGRFKGLHESNFFFYALFADITVLFWVESAFIVKQFNVAFTDDTFGILFVPFFGSR